MPSVQVSSALSPSLGVNTTTSSSFMYDNNFAQQQISLFPTGMAPAAVDTRLKNSNTSGDSCSHSILFPALDHAGSSQNGIFNYESSPITRGLLASTNDKHLTLRSWEYAQDYGPRIIWPPKDSGRNYDFDPEGAMPVLYQSIDLLTRTVVVEPVFQEMLHFLSTFLSRVFYDYAILPDTIVEWMLQRFKASDSSKYGMLATAVLFRANYERSPMTNAFRQHAKELHSLACRQISLDLKNDQLSLEDKLAGLIEVTNYEYYSSTLSRYYPHVTQAASVVRQVIGSDTLDLLNLNGKHTFDVRCFAWCDILHSMATSRPTLLKYESDIGRAQRFGSEDGYANPERGVEWIYGCPDVLTVLMARITALKHSSSPKEEKILHGAKLEQLLLNWQFRSTVAKESVMRVARVGVQEVWRHSATLYLHQAIFQSEATHPTVTNSVKNIIRIASTLKPGINPDCFLSVPYFIAGSFAISQKDRYILKSRLLGCGNERFLRNLADALDDIWAESDATGRFTSWSDKEPPTIIF